MQKINKNAIMEKTKEKLMSQDKTLELVVQELQNRIGQITSNYETQMAVLKAQAQQAIEAKDAEITSLKGN